MSALTPKQKKVWEEALEEPRKIATLTRPRLTVAGEDKTRFLDAWRWRGEEGPAMVLEASVYGAISMDAVGKGCEFDLLIAGVPFRRFTGEVLSVGPDGAFADVEAASAGFHLEGTEIPAALRGFAGTYPSAALYAALSSLADGVGGYEGIDVPLLTEPLFAKPASDFALKDRLKDLAKSIEDASGLIHYDDGRNVARGYLKESLEKPGDPVCEFEVGRDVIGYKHRTRFTERYSEVRIIHRPENGVETVLARALTGTKGVRRSKPLDIETDSPDGAKAQALANREALLRATDLEDASFTVLYQVPHLERGDTVGVTETERGTRRGRKGKWRRRYLVRVAGLSGSEDKRMEVKGTQRLADETFVADPVVVPASRAPRPMLAPVGKDHLDRPYLSDSLSWVSFDDAAQEVVVDEAGARAAGYEPYYDDLSLELVLAEVGASTPPKESVGVTAGSERYTLDELGEYTLDDFGASVEEDGTVDELGDQTVEGV